MKTTPRQDGFRMPGEFEPQERIWMIWPERPDTWRNGGKNAQKAYSRVAEVISKYTPVVMLVSREQYDNCRASLPPEITVIEMSSNDAWARDMGPTFVVNDKGKVRGISWRFNAWGGLTDGLYFPWDQDDKIAEKICQIAGVRCYRTDDFVLEGGSIHVDGQGTVLTTEMCLLSPGRNPSLSRQEIEQYLCEYLNCQKVLWLKDGIDPGETNGHIDDVACFVRPGEVACIYTEDEDHPFYQAAQAAYRTLCTMTDAKGRQLKVHKVCCPAHPVTLPEDFCVDHAAGTVPRKPGDLCIASYLNFLITNEAVIVPQYGDENDGLALEQLRKIFPDKCIEGVFTREIVYGGGNIHCITQQQPGVIR